MRVPSTARRSYLSILKEISPKYSLKELILKPETLIFWPPDVKNQLIGTLMLGRIEGRRRRGWQRRRWLAGIIDSMDMNLSKLWETVKDREAWHATVQGLQRVGHDLVTDNNNKECWDADGLESTNQNRALDKDS